MNEKEYLEFLRQKNKKIMSKCHYCDNFSITIIAEGHIIYPVCKNHDSRSLDIIEEDINNMFERQRDFE
jgi:hypothetical protein